MPNIAPLGGAPGSAPPAPPSTAPIGATSAYEAFSATVDPHGGAPLPSEEQPRDPLSAALLGIDLSGAGGGEQDDQDDPTAPYTLLSASGLYALLSTEEVATATLIVDTRSKPEYRASHLVFSGHHLNVLSLPEEKLIQGVDPAIISGSFRKPAAKRMFENRDFYKTVVIIPGSSTDGTDPDGPVGYLMDALVTYAAHTRLQSRPQILRDGYQDFYYTYQIATTGPPLSNAENVPNYSEMVPHISGQQYPSLSGVLDFLKPKPAPPPPSNASDTFGSYIETTTWYNTPSKVASGGASASATAAAGIPAAATTSASRPLRQPPKPNVLDGLHFGGSSSNTPAAIPGAVATATAAGSANAASADADATRRYNAQRAVQLEQTAKAMREAKAANAEKDAMAIELAKAQATLAATRKAADDANVEAERERQARAQERAAAEAARKDARARKARDAHEKAVQEAAARKARSEAALAAEQQAAKREAAARASSDAADRQAAAAAAEHAARLRAAQVAADKRAADREAMARAMQLEQERAEAMEARAIEERARRAAALEQEARAARQRSIQVAEQKAHAAAAARSRADAQARTRAQAEANAQATLASQRQAQARAAAQPRVPPRPSGPHGVRGAIPPPMQQQQLPPPRSQQRQRPSAPKPSHHPRQQLPPNPASAQAGSGGQQGGHRPSAPKPGPPTSHRLSPRFKAARMQSMAPQHTVSRAGTGKALTGLRNLGNTCFMNAVLQCLCNTAPLSMFFVTGQYRYAINRANKMGTSGELAEEYGELVSALWLRGYKSLSPTYFKQSLSKFAPQFAGTSQQDCQEFCSYLLDGLHEDLNMISKKEYVKHPELDRFSDVEAGRIMWDLHTKRDDSIIQKLFQGQLKSSVRCRTCNYESKSFDPFTFLSLSVPPRSSRTSLEVLLKEFTQQELVSGSDAWVCPKCKGPREAVKSICTWKLPKILIVHLKRFYYEGPFRSKLNTHIKFPLSGLKLPDQHTGRPGQSKSYSLYGVANHIGDINGGHYTAYCKNPDTERWHEFNDSTVTSISESKVCSSQAYMLFYTSVDFDSDLFD